MPVPEHDRRAEASRRVHRGTGQWSKAEHISGNDEPDRDRHEHGRVVSTAAVDDDSHDDEHQEEGGDQFQHHDSPATVGHTQLVQVAEHPDGQTDMFHGVLPGTDGGGIEHAQKRRPEKPGSEACACNLRKDVTRAATPRLLAEKRHGDGHGRIELGAGNMEEGRDHHRDHDSIRKGGGHQVLAARHDDRPTGDEHQCKDRDELRQEAARKVHSPENGFVSISVVHVHLLG